MDKYALEDVTISVQAVTLFKHIEITMALSHDFDLPVTQKTVSASITIGLTFKKMKNPTFYMNLYY